MARFKMARTGVAAGLTARMLNNTAREVAEQVGLFWHRNYLDKHFTRSGAREYGYEPRSGEKGSGRRFQGSYMERKWKKYGHGNPLEFSGESHQWLKFPRIKTSATGGIAKMRIMLGAPNFNRFGSGTHTNSKVDLAHDITAVLPSEINAMAEFARDEFIRRYKSLRGSRSAA